MAPCRLARSSFSASMRLSISERSTGGTGRGGLASIAPIVSLAPPSPSTRSEDASSVSGKSFATSVVSPAGRSSAMTRVTLAPSGYTVTASTAEVTSRSAASAGAAANAARTTRLVVTRWFAIRMSSSRYPFSSMISSENRYPLFRIMLARQGRRENRAHQYETRQGRNRFDCGFRGAPVRRCQGRDRRRDLAHGAGVNEICKGVRPFSIAGAAAAKLRPPQPKSPATSMRVNFRQCC